MPIAALFTDVRGIEQQKKTDKEFIILTRLYDEATLQVATRFMKMPICNAGSIR